jgi:uncharacterized protein
MTNGPAFDCKRCGHCCHGEGGIILTAKDRDRLARHLGLGIEAMLERYAEQVGDKFRLQAGADGYCIFFKQGLGCAEHPGRPDICRAWPFFRGNLHDPVSWEMIQSDCKGVNADCGHRAFVIEGVAYLREGDLIHPPGPESPLALVLDPEALLRAVK